LRQSVSRIVRWSSSTIHHTLLSTPTLAAAFSWALCYDALAHAHGGRARGREGTGWILSRWWIRRLRSCLSGAA
jgi:hypothetical protein